MKKIVYLLFVCVSTISCGGNSNSSIMTREDSIRQVKDSFSNTIVNLSYKGLEIGAKADKIDSLLLSCGVYSTKTDGYFIQGRHEIAYVDKNNEELRDWVTLQVDTIHNRIAKVSLLGKSYKLADFFVQTFNQRYYEEEPVEVNKTGVYEKHHNWLFKNSNIHITDLYHIDPVSGIYHVHDAILIEYEDRILSSEIDSINEKRKESEKAALDRERKQNADKLREDI